MNGYAIVKDADLAMLLDLPDNDPAVRHVAELSDGRTFVAVDGPSEASVTAALERLSVLGTLDQYGSGDWPWPPEVPPDSVPWPMAPRVKAPRVNTRVFAIELFVWEQDLDWDALVALPLLEGALRLHDGSTIAYFSSNSLGELALLLKVLLAIQPALRPMWATGAYARRQSVSA